VPTPIYAAASAVANYCIYFFGGETFSGGVLNQIYHPASNSWSSGKNMSTQIYGMSAAATTGVYASQKIYVMGGKNAFSSGEALNLNRIYDPSTDTWQVGASMPEPRIFLSIVNINDLLYVLGGIPGYGEMQYLPSKANNWQYTPADYKCSLQQPGTFPTETIVLIAVMVAVVSVGFGICFKHKTGSLKYSTDKFDKLLMD
jgi:hypothetical protein